MKTTMHGDIKGQQDQTTARQFTLQTVNVQQGLLLLLPTPSPCVRWRVSTATTSDIRLYEPFEDDCTVTAAHVVSNLSRVGCIVH
jgi:hypothetical protein